MDYGGVNILGKIANGGIYCNGHEMADLKARLLKVTSTLRWRIAWPRVLRKPSASQRETPVGFPELWFSSVAGTARKNSVRSMEIWLAVSSRPTPPRSLLRRNSLRGAASNELNFFFISLSKDLLHKTLIWFSSNVVLTKFWNVPPSARIPLAAITWQSLVFFIII